MLNTSPAELCLRFRSFIDRAKSLGTRSVVERPDVAFRRFIARAEEVLIAPLQRDAKALRQQLELLRPWLLPQRLDLFEVAGLTYDENAYTELIRWALCPEINSYSAGQCQKAWLRRLGVPAEDPFHAGEVSTQLVTKDGIPDLIIRFKQHVIVVEAKTGTAEHVTPLGKMQTESYPIAVRAALSLPASTRVYVILLTPDRVAGHSSAAIAASYFELALALAEGAAASQLNPPTRSAYTQIISHLAVRAIPVGVSIPRLADSLGSWTNDDSGLIPIRSQLRALLTVRNLIQQKAAQ